MTPVETKIGRFNAETGTVPVTFTSGAITHKRAVNAVLDAKGKFDKDATDARVAEVASGVAHKIAAGVIRADAGDGEA